MGDRSLRIRVTCANNGCPLQLFDHRGDAVVAPDAQVVTLGDIVREHHP